MKDIKQVLEKDGIDAVQFMWTRKHGIVKPAQYYTFQMVVPTSEFLAKVQMNGKEETYLVKVFSKEDPQMLVDSTVKNIEDEGFAILSIGQKTYESVTGYYCVPIILKF